MGYKKIIVQLLLAKEAYLSGRLKPKEYKHLLKSFKTEIVKEDYKSVQNNINDMISLN